MRVLSLFSGGGLGDYGLTLAGMEIVGQVEIDEYCQKILSLRWPEVPKWRDIHDVTGKEVLERCGSVDLVSGGFPCQPFSQAGQRKGEADKRHLWPEMLRIILEVRPRWVLAENVPGLLSISDGRVFGAVVRDLAESGYCVEWDCVSASAVGAPHQRDRIWILAHSGHDRRSAESREQQKERAEISDSSGSGNVANTDKLDAQRRISGSDGDKKRKEPKKRSFRFRSALCDTTSERFSNRPIFSMGESGKIEEPERSNWWAIEPDVGRVAHGIANRVDRLKCLGNGQVVQVVEWIGKQIMKAEC